MHKSELEGMTLAELTALAGKLGAELSDDQTTLIYNILDAQSLQAPVEAPKKRGRKPKAAAEPKAQTGDATSAPQSSQTEKGSSAVSKTEQPEEKPASQTSQAAPAADGQKQQSSKSEQQSSKPAQQSSSAAQQESVPDFTFEEYELPLVR